MDYIKKFLIICFILLLAGCSTLGKKDKVFEAGYRVGVKENIEDFAKSFYGNDFPYFYWSSPVIQNVRIPAQIENGLFVPEHNEPVVITPAQWRKKLTYPIHSPKDEGKKDLQQAEGKENYALSDLNFSGRDITVFPESYAGVERDSQGKDPR